MKTLTGEVERGNGSSYIDVLLKTIYLLSIPDLQLGPSWRT